MGLFQCVFGQRLAVAYPDEQKSEQSEGQEIPQHCSPHPGIESRALTTADHRLRMLGAEEPDGEVNKRHAQRAQYGKGGRQQRCLSAGREAAQKQKLT